MSKIELPILYSQWDQRWAKTLLGTNTDPKYNIYNYGCLITCLCMVARYYGQDTDPGKINEELKSIKGFVSGGLYVYGSFSKLFSGIKENKTDTPLPLTDEELGEIRSAIDNGFPVMIEIDVNPRTVANDQHYVLVTGYNPDNENDLTVADPLGGKLRSLKDYLGFMKPNARKTIDSYIIYSGKLPRQNTSMVCLAKDDAERRTHNSEQWIKLVGYLGIEGDPTTTQFDKVQDVIAGYKSRDTDLKMKLESAARDGAGFLQERENFNTQISTLKDELLKQRELYLAQIKAIKDNAPNMDELSGQYEGRIVELNKKLEDVAIELGDVKVELARCQNTDGEIKIPNNGLRRAVEFLLKYFNDIFNKG